MSVELTLKFKENHKKLVDPVCMIIRKALLTSIRRYAVIGMLISSDISDYKVMEPIGTSTVTPMDIATEFSKYNVYVSERALSSLKDNVNSFSGNSPKNSSTYVTYVKTLNSIKEIRMSDFFDIIEDMESYHDIVLARFNQEVTLKITLYIAPIDGDIDRMESNSIIESESSYLDADMHSIFTLPGVLFPSNINILKEVSDSTEVTIVVDVPESMQEQIVTLISKEISEIFSGLEIS
jgi:hypothetical protein